MVASTDDGKYFAHLVDINSREILVENLEVSVRVIWKFL